MVIFLLMKAQIIKTRKEKRIQKSLKETAKEAKKAVELENKGEYDKSFKIWLKIFNLYDDDKSSIDHIYIHQ